jgi:hypothetical protein
MCYCTSTSTNIEHIVTIQDYPGATDDAQKVPSRIAYEMVDDGGVIDLEPEAMGFQITSDMHPIAALMKLHLDKEARLTEFDDMSLKSLGQDTGRLPDGKTAEEVIVDYLKALYQCLRDHMQHRGLLANFDTWPVDYYITHPASWTDAAKSATRDVAVQAGFGAQDGDTIRLISEPEAAAVTALTELHAKHSTIPIRVNDGCRYSLVLRLAYLTISL